MVSWKALISLMRPQQWYKNLIIFVPVFFSTLALEPSLLYLTFLGFVSLCLASSGNYVLNDIIDKESDRHHPEKKLRPIASGAIHVSLGVFLTLILFACSLALAYSLNFNFFLLIIFFIVLTKIYSLYLKKIVFVDVLVISVNFVIRAVAGIILLDRPTTPWLIVCPFFLALFLAVGKRKADVNLLKQKATAHKKVLQFYTPELTDSLLIIATTLLLISYTLYAFLSEHQYYLLLSLPFALYLVFYYFSLLNSDSSIPRHPEQALRDKHILIGVLLWGIVTLLAIYLPQMMHSLI